MNKETALLKGKKATPAIPLGKLNQDLEHQLSGVIYYEHYDQRKIHTQGDCSESESLQNTFKDENDILIDLVILENDKIPVTNEEGETARNRFDNAFYQQDRHQEGSQFDL